MALGFELYITQLDRWPASGCHIMAQYDDKSIIVYQAYKDSIAEYAVNNCRFGGTDFSFNRMSWIKTSFLWMMYRSDWARKPDQTNILAIKLQREGFEEMLKHAVHSTFHRNIYNDNHAWKNALKSSDVRLQWDPDHDPFGNKTARRAIQLGLRGNMLKKYSSDWIMSIDNITEYVHQQYIYVAERKLNNLRTPIEKEYLPKNKETVEWPR